MSASLDLLQDTLSFLSFLHAHDIRSFGSRWLPPAALRTLNPQLLKRDVIAPPSHSRTGKRGTSERETDRIRFIHFLCEAAHLVAKTGSYLKPTLRVTRWLAADQLDQLHALFDGDYPAQPTRLHDQLWQTYRLPGYSLSSPTLSLAPLFDILRQMRSDEHLKIGTLLKLIALPEDSGGSETPDSIVRGVLDQLARFGVLAWRARSTVELTPLGLVLLNRPADASAFTGQADRLNARLEFVRLKLELAQPTFAQLYELADYAELVSPAPIRRYRLERDRVHRALQRGQTLDGLLRFFENLIRDALPERLHRQLREWAAQLDQVSIRRLTVLEVRDPATLVELTRAQRVRDSLGRTLSPRAILVRPVRLPALVRQLKKRSLAPRLYFSDPNLSDHSTTRLYDNPSLAQLYYAALLNHQLSDRLSAPYRIDYSIVLDLARQLSIHDRDLAQSLAEEAAQKLTEDQRPWTVVAESALSNQHSAVDDLPSNVDLPPSVVRPSSPVIHLIEHAIRTNTPLTLTYRSPVYGDSTRTIEPLRLEWHGDIPYFIAYCRLRQDERTFRVDRILSIT